MWYVNFISFLILRMRVIHLIRQKALETNFPKSFVSGITPDVRGILHTRVQGWTTLLQRASNCRGIKKFWRVLRNNPTFKLYIITKNIKIKLKIIYLTTPQTGSYRMTEFPFTYQARFLIIDSRLYYSSLYNFQPAFQSIKNT